MRAIDLTNVKEAGDFSRPAPGAYICTIKKVEDNTEKEYLMITFDITEGDYAGYYDQLREDHPDWSDPGLYYRSYRSTALGFFKRFCSAVSKSNPGFNFDGQTNADEKTLAGKKIGLVLREEEYYGNDGEKKTRLKVDKEFAIADIAKQKVPECKRIIEESKPSEFLNVPDAVGDSVPWS